MSADVALLDLRLRRRAVLGYTLGMAAYTFIVVALYPTFQHETSLDRFTKSGSKIAALFGANGSLTSPDGWMNANVYSNFLPLIALVLTMGYGAAALAGQNENGSLALVATLPLTRRALLRQKIATLVVHGIVITVVTAALTVLGRGFDLDLAVTNVLTASLGVLLLALDFGLLALAVGALTGSRGAALGITSAVAAASYLISSLAPVTDWIHPLRVVSLFWFSVGDNQLRHGLSVTDLVVLVAVGLVLVVVADLAFARLDIR